MCSLRAIIIIIIINIIILTSISDVMPSGHDLTSIRDVVLASHDLTSPSGVLPTGHIISSSMTNYNCVVYDSLSKRQGIYIPDLRPRWFNNTMANI